MLKIINILLNILKMFMLLICFVLTFYIIVNMYRRLDKNIFDGIKNFIPFILLFIMFSINFIFKQKIVLQNTFYNITCCLVFGMLLFAIYRTLFDKNMVIMLHMGYNINFNYFADIIAPMRALLYGLALSDILLLASQIKVFDGKYLFSNNRDEEEVKKNKKSLD